MKRKIFAAALLVASVHGAPASAQIVNFLSDSALAEMNKDDKALANAAFRDALNGAADGETRSWSNDKSGASGSITLLRSYHDAATKLDCRETKIELKARGRENKGPYFLCKTAEGQWKFAKPPQAAPAARP
ncbi:MAG: hypothetical protein ACREVL_19810 [Solimonas sp.]